MYTGFASLVVMYSLKSFITSHSLSPTLTCTRVFIKVLIYVFSLITLNVEPDLMKFCSNTLSKAGSSSSATSSIRSGRPSDKASSR